MTTSLLILITIVIILIISITWTNSIGAPWVPTTMEMVNKILQIADVGPDDTVYDLGCGDGRMLITAAQKYGARAVGIEIDPLRYAWCQMLITILRLRKQVRIVYGNFFDYDLSEADVVICYLLQETNNKLEEKLLDELPFGARVVSNFFTFQHLYKVREDGDASMYLLFSEEDLQSSPAGN